MKKCFAFACACLLAWGACQPARASAPVPTILFNVEWTEAGENHKLHAIFGQNAWRVELPDQKWTVIYDPKTETFTGLEHRDFTYWKFQWPQVLAAVQKSKSSGTQLAAWPDLESSNAEKTPQESKSPPFLWKTTSQRKTISGLSCEQWQGSSATEDVEAWCAPPPELLVACMRQLKVLQEPLALAAVRPLLPPVLFKVCESLEKAGVQPLEIAWGKTRERNRASFRLPQAATVSSDRFLPPPNFRPTTLASLDGILEEAKP